jgi:glycosyltransferase involved in cell wall biosynthesis
MKICFWGNIARTLKGNPDGGGELQIALLAKALIKGGHEVVVIDYETPEDFITEDGIRVLKVTKWNDGIPVFRTFTHRLPQLYKSLIHQRADIYYCRIREFRHIIAYRAARKVGAKFILGLASDLDIMSFGMRVKNIYIPNFSFGNFFWWFFSGILAEVVYPFLLRKSDIIFAQHEGQRKILQKKGLKSVLFPNLIELPPLTVSTNNNNNYFIYVGSLDKRKGFTEFFKIVRKTPNHSFKVIGEPRDKTGFKYFEELKSFKNVRLFGRLSHPDTMCQIETSKALISTSWMEGFPNVFIEAWSFGIPVLSLFVDPGDTIKTKELGVAANGNMNKLIEVMNNIKPTPEFEKRAKAYVENSHNLNPFKIEEISKLFNDIYKL